MNKKIDWYDILIDLISGMIIGIVGFVIYFFTFNLANFWFPGGANIVPIYLKGAVLGMWLTAHVFRKNNMILSGLCLSVILLTFIYNSIASKLITLPWGPFDTVVFINSFITGAIIITVIKLIITRKKTEPTKENTTTN